MKQALEFAKQQADFEEHGSLCHQRGGKCARPVVSKQAEREGLVSAITQPPLVKNPAQPSLVKNPAQPPLVRSFAMDPAYQMARASAQQMIARLEFAEESRRLSNSDSLDFETDVDRMFVRPVQANPLVSPHLAARQAALQYIQRLQHAGQLISRDCIPHALRDEYDDNNNLDL
jgi:hypothetical protein